MYTIHIRRQFQNSNEIQNSSTSISSLERRYSDFKRLDVLLRRHYGNRFMRPVSFPSRLLVGNFKPSTIAERSRAFEQYLTHVASIPVLCCSVEFSSFFCHVDLQRALLMVKENDYLSAQQLFLSVVMIQQKLLTAHKVISNHPELVSNMSALTACYIASNNHQLAAVTGGITIRLLTHDNIDLTSGDISIYLLPLLKETVYSCWKIGKDKTDLDQMLEDLRGAGNVENISVTLLELLRAKIHDR